MMGESSPMTPNKRILPYESSLEDRVTKRRRSLNTTDSPKLGITKSAKWRSDGNGRGPRQDSAVEGFGDESGDDVDQDDDTSSSGSDPDETSVERNSDEAQDSLGQPLKTSSDVEDDSSEEAEHIQTVPLAKKPPITAAGQSSDLRSKLSSFLPKLQKANADLLKSGEVMMKRLDEVEDDEEHYIEMNLGLGVLKEKKSDTRQTHGIKLSEDHRLSSDEDSDSGFMQRGAERNQVDPRMTPLRELMGGKQPSGKKPNIREIHSSSEAGL
jgi:Domain of unknown function (DUF4598)